MLATFVVSAFLAAAPAPAKANPFLAEAKVLSQGLNYEKALERLKRAFSWPGTSASEMAEVHLYRGLSHLQLGREQPGREALRAALLADPNIQLPPMCSPKLATAFNQEAASIRPAKPPPEVAPTPPPVIAAPPPVETTAAPLAATAPAEPPAAVQKEHVRWPSYVALAAAVALAGVGGVMGYQARDSASQADKAEFASEHVRLSDQAQSRAKVANGLYGAAGGMAALGLVFFFVF